MSSKKYLLVFDSNVLYVRHNQKGDFTRYHFNGTFDNVIDKIEELDIYQNVLVALPTVVWEEIREQKIESYYEKLQALRRTAEKFTFPGCAFVEKNKADFCYETYITAKSIDYKESLSLRLVRFVELGIPSERRYKRIVERAVQKKPPFEGKGSNSDKGFKDTLLWESILEFVENDDQKFDVLLYTHDKMFNEELEKEFASIFPERSIYIFRKDDENGLLRKLEQIALELDFTVFIPPNRNDEEMISEWFFTEDFQLQFSNWAGLFDIASGYISYGGVQILGVHEVEIDYAENGNIESFSAWLHANITFKVNEKPKFTDDHDVQVIVFVDEEGFGLEHVNVISLEE